MFLLQQLPCPGRVPCTCGALLKKVFKHHTCKYSKSHYTYDRSYLFSEDYAALRGKQRCSVIWGKSHPWFQKHCVKKREMQKVSIRTRFFNCCFSVIPAVRALRGRHSPCPASPHACPWAQDLISASQLGPFMVWPCSPCSLTLANSLASESAAWAETKWNLSKGFENVFIHNK